MLHIQFQISLFIIGIARRDGHRSPSPRTGRGSRVEPRRCRSLPRHKPALLIRVTRQKSAEILDVFAAGVHDSQTTKMSQLCFIEPSWPQHNQTVKPPAKRDRGINARTGTQTPKVDVPAIAKGHTAYKEILWKILRSPIGPLRDSFHSGRIRIIFRGSWFKDNQAQTPASIEAKLRVGCKTGVTKNATKNGQPYVFNASNASRKTNLGKAPTVLKRPFFDVLDARIPATTQDTRVRFDERGAVANAGVQGDHRSKSTVSRLVQP